MYMQTEVNSIWIWNKTSISIRMMFLFPIIQDPLGPCIAVVAPDPVFIMDWAVSFYCHTLLFTNIKLIT